MQSSIINIFEILNTGKRLVSAGFSSGYNFDEINAAEYFNELLENSTALSPIFSGILILERQSDEVTVVDGLQRLTTVCLLLCALCENYKNTTEKNEETREKIFNRFLMINGETKLYLSGVEQDIYQKIVLGEKLSPKETKNNLYKTYLGFLNEIKEQKITGTRLFKVISKIQFMTIVSDKSQISPRELYQALNNKDKSQVNLITDFIETNFPDSAKLWSDAVKRYKRAKKSELLDDFIRDFLIVQNEDQYMNQNALYNKFKSYFRKISKYLKHEAIIENLCTYSKYYLKILKSDFKDEEIQRQISVLNDNNGQDAYPYLMEVMDDLENGHINREIFLDILMMINSFIVKRSEDPQLGLAVDFTSLSKELNKMLVIKDYVPKIFDEHKFTINELNTLSTFEV